MFKFTDLALDQYLLLFVKSSWLTPIPLPAMVTKDGYTCLICLKQKEI